MTARPAARPPARPARWGVYVISSGRPANVPRMEGLLHPDPITWVVPHAERHDYAAAGAATLLPVPPPAPGHYQLPVQRQAALDHAAAHGQVCIQSDDDLRRFKSVHLTGPKSATASLAAWTEVRDGLLAALDGAARLSGLPPTDNALFAAHSAPYRGLVNAQITATDPAAAPRWDPALPLKEDYDFTCQHLATYGRVMRLTGYIAKYESYANRGGVVALRTPELEAFSAATLLERWPQYLMKHRTRPGEIAFLPAPREDRP